jgi:hypothetical protein
VQLQLHIWVRPAAKGVTVTVIIKLMALARLMRVMQVLDISGLQCSTQLLAPLQGLTSLRELIPNPNT